MKIIDLLNKIANKEKLPKKIKYNDSCWKVGIAENEEVDYLNDSEFELFSQYLQYALIESLNDEVEILEEEDVEKIEEFTCFLSDSHNKDTFRNYCNAQTSKINEVIRVLNKIIKESKE